MTQPEYEAKKCECWDDFWRETNGAINYNHEAVKVLSDALFTAFDRAYAFGREKETITQEDVEKAAEEYAEKAMEHVYSGEWDSEYVQGLIEAAWYDGYTALGKQGASIGTINGDVVINL